MPTTRGCPRPRPVWIDGECRSATARYTIPRGVLLKAWRAILAGIIHGRHPDQLERLVFEFLDTVAADLRGHPRLISARHGAQMIAAMPAMPLALRVKAAITSRVYDQWNTKRYPCYSQPLPCYLANNFDYVEWTNSTNLGLVRRQLKEHADARISTSAENTKAFLCMAM